METANPNASDALRALPSVDLLLRIPEIAHVPRRIALREARRMLEDLRTDVLAGRASARTLDGAFARGGSGAHELAARCARAAETRHRRVVNATGIVLHTGIGRAPLASQALAALADAAGYAWVELDPTTGERNEREECIASLVGEILGVSGALVVNNNAALVALVLRALACGREVIVSRGELVEIGGGFRMPDVMAQAGCKLVEVGATNRTHLRDYERAITEHTAMLLKVHTSNFRIVGFQSSPSLQELVELGRRSALCVFEDLGSGLLVEEPIEGLEHEPRVQDSLRAGVPLVAFSGDKLLGGPQCGILAGDRELVARVRAHPLYRALRCDKLTLAGLEATLRIYRDGDPLAEIPALALIAQPAEQLERAARELARKLASLRATVVASESFAGSGANPARPLPSFAVALPGGAKLAAALRADRELPVVARVQDGAVLLDLRTLTGEDQDEVAAVVQRCAAAAGA